MLYPTKPLPSSRKRKDPQQPEVENPERGLRETGRALRVCEVRESERERVGKTGSSYSSSSSQGTFHALPKSQQVCLWEGALQMANGVSVGS